MYASPKDITVYAEKHTSPQSSVLYNLERETHLTQLMPQMVSGHLQGAFLAMLSRLLKPTYVLEIGTFTGYSAICLCEGLQKNGQLHTIDINDEFQAIQEKYIAQAGLNTQIVQHLGNALDIIPTLDYSFDMVFIDADKRNYSRYYELVIDKVRPGGLIIADNILWSGKVLAPRYNDKDALALNAYNHMVQADNRVHNLLLPVGDGWLVAQKR